MSASAGVTDQVRVQNFYDGAFHDSLTGNVLDNIEPATGLVYGSIPNSDASDVDQAVRAAVKAFPAWSRTGTHQRAKYLYKIADLIDSHAKELVAAESRDNGKTLTMAANLDIPRASANFRFFAGAILHHEEMSTVMDNGSVNYVVSQPLGVAALISPWNLPLYLLTWKIAPAIAVGNTCVCKPSEFTSVSAWLLCRLFNEAGLPPGVVNIVFGLGPTAGQALIEHPKVALISFTGGTVTGKKIAQIAASQCKKASLELGGKNPTLIFDDCDLEKAIATTIRSSFINQGEICLCGERLFVQKGIYEKFLTKFVEAAKVWRVGDPNDASSNMGALISEQHLQKCLHYMNLARQLGGKIECGGERVTLPGRCEKGYFFSPTIITGLSASCQVNQEEIFGPVVSVIPFETVSEAISLANEIPYGLSASVFTENVNTANLVGMGLQVGTVWVNCWLNRDLRVPFGGMKQSGIGREGGKFSIDFYTEKKTICVQYSTSL